MTNREKIINVFVDNFDVFYTISVEWGYMMERPDIPRDQIQRMKEKILIDGLFSYLDLIMKDIASSSYRKIMIILNPLLLRIPNISMFSVSHSNISEVFLPFLKKNYLILNEKDEATKTFLENLTDSKQVNITVIIKEISIR